jgi:hypothetical protein
MSWAVGDHEGRDVGYGVPSLCDHPGCTAKIDRGLSYVCGGDVYGGEHGCGLFFCAEHMHYAGDKRDNVQLCIRCCYGKQPYEPTPDLQEWIDWKLTDESWADWRAANPDWVKAHEHA